MIHRMEAMRDLLMAGPIRRGIRRTGGHQAWPVTPGAYVVGNPTAPVAVCTLTSNELMQSVVTLPGVAIAGRVYTPNLGIEKIILNVTANPAIRFLLLCGKESPVFHPAQALRLLLSEGVTAEKRIISAEGHVPVLNNLTHTRIETFRRQIELIDHTGETRMEVIEHSLQALLKRNPGAFMKQSDEERKEDGEAMQPELAFTPIRPGGQRQPLVYDTKGFFVITLNREAGEIILRHHLPDNTPAHEMRGRAGESMLLGLLREDLISQLSHAGYLGGELAKAETALRLHLRYEQDQPLRPFS
jgi:tetrahydromethanopterin S-methyltransferase subunit A